MKTICPSCNYDLRSYPVTIELDSHNRSVYCPACSTAVIDEIREVSEKYIFFDDDAKSFIQWVAPKQAAAQPEVIVDLAPLGKLSVKIRAKSRDFKQIFYERVLVFQVDGHISLTQVFASPENQRRYGIDIQSSKLQPTENWIDVKFNLRGGFSDTVSIRALVTKSDAGGVTGSALMVWPNFKRPAWAHAHKQYAAWKDYFVYFASQDSNIKLTSLRIVGNEPEMSANFTDLTRPMGSLDFPPEYIEIKGESVRAMGNAEEFCACFCVKLNTCEITRSTMEPLRLSVDFGTSNTCFYYLVRTATVKDVKPLKLNDHTHVLIGGLELESSLAHTWMPRFKEQTLIPSELVFRLEPETIFKSSDPIRPIVDYNIPPLKWRAGEQTRITTGFKWQQATEPDKVALYHLQLQKMFLEMVFRLVLAELASRSDLLGGSSVHSSEIELTITYPLSMSEAKFQNLRNSFESAARAIAQTTGINLIIAAYVDESRAGEQGTYASGPGQKIYVDIGGGTTDVSVVREAPPDGKRIPLIVDSLRYAGNDFLAVLASDSKRGGLSDRSLVELQRRIRAEESVLNDPATFGNTTPRLEEAQKALDRFIEGLIQYMARMIAYKMNGDGIRRGRHVAAEAEEKLTVYLLGNGWRFVLFSPRDPLANPDMNPRDIIKEEVKARLEKELEKFRKGRIIPMKPNIELQHPEDPKTVVARGALDVIRSANQEIEKKEPQTFLGSDIHVMTASGERDFRWNTPVPLNLGQVANNVWISNDLAGFEHLAVPDYQHDHAPVTKIQDINITKHIYERGRIVKSALNFYLEHWHKRYLTGKWQ